MGTTWTYIHQSRAGFVTTCPRCQRGDVAVGGWDGTRVHCCGEVGVVRRSVSGKHTGHHRVEWEIEEGEE